MKPNPLPITESDARSSKRPFLVVLLLLSIFVLAHSRNMLSNSAATSTDSIKIKSKALNRSNAHRHAKISTPQPVAAAVSAADPPPLANMHTPVGCPAWMAEYAAFHKQHRGTPGAKYLLYAACPGRSGLGDRIRGMMYLTRQAAAHKRVVLFTWRGEPHEAERWVRHSLFRLPP